MVIFITADREELGFLDLISLDVDLNKEKDFELIVPIDYLKKLDIGFFIAQDKSEVGGRIGTKEIIPSEKIIKFTGYTWRGILSKRIIKPLGDYEEIRGNVADYFNTVFLEEGIVDYFEVESTKRLTKLRLPRYCTILEALDITAKTLKLRLTITYHSKRNKVIITFEDYTDFSDYAEIDEDNSIYLKFYSERNKVNHLICLGSGELRDRKVVELYADGKGKISTVPYYKGIDDVTEIYENTTADTEELLDRGVERLKELINKDYVFANVENLTLEAKIGDLLMARDEITGTVVSKFITNKVVKINSEDISIEYSVEED